MFLMLKDVEILYFDLEENIVEVLRDDLLPFSIRSCFKGNTTVKNLVYNIQKLKGYLSSRVLSLSRDNAKFIYTTFGIPQRDDIDSRVKICLACKGVSVNDSYWIKDDMKDITFNSVNIRKNKFKEIIDISLDGMSPTATTLYINPELTTHGLFRKAWTRLDDGLYLLKSDKHVNNLNTKMEVLSSDILKCFSNKISCVEYSGRYRKTQSGKLYVDRCKNFVGEDYSFVEAWELIDYANTIGVNFKSIYGFNSIASSVPVLDYILANTDRHTQNYGFLMDNNTGELKELAPLFDFNMCLISDWVGVDVAESLSQMFNDGKNILGVADEYRWQANIQFNKQQFDKLRNKYTKYNKILDSVLYRCDIMNLV